MYVGVVIGETAEIGDNVSMLHKVTLGGSGSLLIIPEHIITKFNNFTN